MVFQQQTELSNLMKEKVWESSNIRSVLYGTELKYPVTNYITNSISLNKFRSKINKCPTKINI